MPRPGATHAFTFLLITAALAITPVRGATTKNRKSTTAPDTARFPRDGGSYGLGGIWFDREPKPEPVQSEAPAATDQEGPSGMEPEEIDDEGTGGGLAPDVSWNLSTTGIHETRPAHHASDHPDWHWDSEFAPEAEWSITEHFSVPLGAGLRFMRFASSTDLDSDEPFASIGASWRFAPGWLAALHHESFWDLEPGFGSQVFAAHTTDLRLQYDTTAAESPGPVRWQSYLEAAHSFAEPALHDWYGMGFGGGCALRLVPHTLRFQTGAGVSFQKYPNYHVNASEVRQGWTTRLTGALVWTPTAHAQVSLGIDFLQSAENGVEFRFTNIAVPLVVSWSW